MFPDIINITKNVFNPSKIESYLSNELTKATWNSALINFSIPFILIALIEYAILFLGFKSPDKTYIFQSIFGPAIACFVGVVLLPISLWSVHFPARLMGSKGSILGFAQVTSIVRIGLSIFSILAIPLFFFYPSPPLNSSILISCLIILVGVPLVLYFFFCQYKAIKVVYQLSMVKSISILIFHFVILLLLSTVLSNAINAWLGIG